MINLRLSNTQNGSQTSKSGSSDTKIHTDKECSSDVKEENNDYINSSSQNSKSNSSKNFEKHLVNEKIKSKDLEKQK